MRLVADGFQNKNSVETNTAAAAAHVFRVASAAAAHVANDAINDISERNKFGSVASKLLQNLALLLLPLCCRAMR